MDQALEENQYPTSALINRIDLEMANLWVFWIYNMISRIPASHLSLGIFQVVAREKYRGAVPPCGLSVPTPYWSLVTVRREASWSIASHHHSPELVKYSV